MSITLQYLMIFLISIIPVVELRGAIPVAEGMGLDIFWYYPIAIIGNMLPVPFIYWFAIKVLEWGKDKKIIGKFFTWCLQKGEKGGEKIKSIAGKKGIFWALLLFVGIPLPGTGAWTGTLAASFLRLDFKTSIIAIMLGVVVAGIIMAIGSKVVATLGWSGVIAIACLVAIIVICSILLNKKKTKNE